MKAKQIVSQIRKTLRDKARSKSEMEKKKARATLGNEVIFLGLKVCKVRKIAEPFAQKLKKEKDFETALGVADEFYKSGVFEEVIVAESILKGFKKYFDDSTFGKFDEWIGYIKNWANIDMLCGWLIAPLIIKDQSKIERILKWAQSKNRWRKRAAAVSLVKHVRYKMYLSQAFQIAEKLIGDKDEIVQKGVGWLLKEMGGNYPNETVEFLTKWRTKTSRLILRIACEKLSSEEKKKVLGSEDISR